MLFPIPPHPAMPQRNMRKLMGDQPLAVACFRIEGTARKADVMTHGIGARADGAGDASAVVVVMHTYRGQVCPKRPFKARARGQIHIAA